MSATEAAGGPDLLGAPYWNLLHHEAHEARLWGAVGEFCDNLGVAIDEPERVDWQNLSADCIRFRVDVLLEIDVRYDYDGAPDGVGYSIESLTMRAAQ